MVALLAAMTLAGCGTEEWAAAPTAPPIWITPAAQDREPGHRIQEAAPCDPGGGWPQPSPTCPAGEPVTGWVVAMTDGAVTVRLLRTHTNDAEGAAYAAAHDVEFPFPNDYRDVSLGEKRVYAVTSETICTGIATVGYREPLADHVVPCPAYGPAVELHPVTSALWLDGDAVVQLSELYRP